MVIRSQLRDDANGDARWLEVDASNELVLKSADGVTSLNKVRRHFASWSTIGILSGGDTGQRQMWPIALRLDLVSIRVDANLGGATTFKVELLRNGAAFTTPIIQTVAVGTRKITSAVATGTPTLAVGDELSWRVNTPAPTGGDRPTGFHIAVAMTEV